MCRVLRGKVKRIQDKDENGILRVFEAALLLAGNKIDMVTSAHMLAAGKSLFPKLWQTHPSASAPLQSMGAPRNVTAPLGELLQPHHLFSHGTLS
jgi:hypothetical protein